MCMLYVNGPSRFGAKSIRIVLKCHMNVVITGENKNPSLKAITFKIGNDFNIYTTFNQLFFDLNSLKWTKAGLIYQLLAKD